VKKLVLKSKSQFIIQVGRIAAVQPIQELPAEGLRLTGTEYPGSLGFQGGPGFFRWQERIDGQSMETAGYAF
jgi:hypothetical protein